ncbi:MAG: single-stranded-DNA-specific exonuclease RecJ [Elusimicrobiota bacterium]
MIAKEWDVYQPDPGKVEELTAKYGISKVLAKMLINRGYDTVEKAQDIVNPKLSMLHNPFLLPDMQKVVERVRLAVERKEPILIYGDTDADGIAGVTVLKQALDKYHAITHWYVPQNQGYGLHNDSIKEYADKGVKVIITTDCGVTGIDEIAYANKLGVEVLITDHHIPADKLPEAFAILNPRLTTSKYPFNELSGCGLAYKLAEALHFSYNSEFYNKEMVVVDIETTGLDAQGNEILELAALKCINFVPVDEFQSLIKPVSPIPAEMTKIHGITDEMCVSAPGVKEALIKFVEYIGDRNIVAHNGKAFDLVFINAWLKKSGLQELNNQVVDTLQLSKSLLPLKSHSLGNLVNTFSLPPFRHHRAMADCYATNSVFHQLVWVQINQKTGNPLEYLDLVALGSIADAVSMTGENRVLIREGLSLLLRSPRICVKMILEHCDLQDKKILTTRQISWLVTPFLNAAGRLGKANIVIEFLLTDNRAEAQALFANILDLNNRRREMQNTALRKLLLVIEAEYDLKKDKIIVLNTTGIEPGISGVIANQLVQRYYRPVIILISDNNVVRGNARAPTNIDVLKLISECAPLLNRYGGHRSAAGLELPKENVDKFVKGICAAAERMIDLRQVRPVIQVDDELEWDNITPKLLDDINTIEPYGVGNAFPVFKVCNTSIKNHAIVGREKLHLRMEFDAGPQKIEGIARGMGFLGYEISKSTKLDIVFQIETNVSEDSVRLILLDFKPSGGWKNNIYEEIEL